MKRTDIVSLSAAIVVLAASAAHAQAENSEWQSLNQQTIELHRAGHFDQAIVMARKALDVAENKFGPEHPDVATSLNNLALLYDKQGQYAQAELLHMRALTIREKVLGPYHPEVATSLNNLAFLYKMQGQYAQAEPLYKRALTIKEKAFGPEHPHVALGLNNLAELYQSQGKYALAESLHKRALTIRENVFGPNHPDVARSLNNLAGLYNKQGRYEQAEQLYLQALLTLVEVYGPEHLSVATGLNNLAGLYNKQGQYEQAEQLYKRALAIQEKAHGPNHPNVALGLNNLAELYQSQGQYAQAESLLKRALSIREKAFGQNHPDVAMALNNLATLSQSQGQYEQATPFLMRALQIYENALGSAHPAVATILNNLALNYDKQSQYSLAEPLYQRALEIREKAFGSAHPDVAISLNNLAELYRAMGQCSQAESLYQRALTIQERMLGPDHPHVAHTLNNLALLYRMHGKNPQAELLHNRALAIREQTLGPSHPDVALSLNNLASLYSSQGLYSQAGPLYQRALAINENTLGASHHRLATSLNNLGQLYANQGEYAAALPLTRRASAIYRKRIFDKGTDETATHEATSAKKVFLLHLTLLERNPTKEDSTKIIDEAFQVAQLQQATGTSAAIAKMAARFSRGDDAIAGLVRRKQDALDRRSRNEASLVKAASQPPEKRNKSLEQKLRDDIVQLDKEIEAIDTELNARFPEYQELTRPEPLMVNQVQALLRADEAMVAYAIGGDRSWLWVVRPGKAEFIPLTADLKSLAEHVKEIRARMEPDAAGKLQKVDVAHLHALYQGVFVPAVPHLGGVRHILLVPAGPLQSLPFGMLVASPPPNIESFTDYRQVDWLAKHYALSVLPSVSSIRAFRQFAKAGVAQEPFIGFGDPLLSDDPGAARQARAQLRLAGLFRNPPASGTGSPQTDIANVRLIKQQARLPETAVEIKAMAAIVKAGKDSIWLQDKATEANVKKLDLSRHRIVAFATHGVMAGELGKEMEPGLLLTPPVEGTPEDDGYLAAGEIARLKLNADWVLLSACNTAAADGSLGAEGLSGLAKAFFYAGSRTLLVSHWPVASEATLALTTSMLREHEANPRQGKAEAHRRAMLAMMNTPRHPEYAHPLFWAPFVVVGEGGDGVRARGK